MLECTQCTVYVCECTPCESAHVCMAHVPERTLCVGVYVYTCVLCTRTSVHTCVLYMCPPEGRRDLVVPMVGLMEGPDPVPEWSGVVPFSVTLSVLPSDHRVVPFRFTLCLRHFVSRGPLSSPYLESQSRWWWTIVEGNQGSRKILDERHDSLSERRK